MVEYINGYKIIDGYFENGSATLPSLSFINDLDSGFYRIGANNIGLALNGSKVIDYQTTATYFSHGKIGLDSTDYMLFTDNTQLVFYINGTAQGAIKTNQTIEFDRIWSRNVSSPMYFKSWENDDASAVAFEFDTNNSLTNSSAILMGWKNATSLKAAISKEGTYYQTVGTTQTTDATATAITAAKVTPSTNSVYGFEYEIMGLKSDYSEAAAYRVMGLARKDGSTLTLVSYSVQIIGEDDATWDVILEASDNDIQPKVTGKAATTINWTAIGKYWKGR
jgi:hypothetical protein